MTCRRRPHRAAARSRPAAAAATRGPRQGRPPPPSKPTPSLLDRPHLHARWGPATPETREGGRAPATAVGLRAQAGGVLRRRREEEGRWARPRRRLGLGATRVARAGGDAGVKDGSPP
uniref:Uncharacterized protein n=1 Tax=Aegilops tauschii subsp. strangulata TaxID=200361 RepID=A0A453KC43_AEGTS